MRPSKNAATQPKRKMVILPFKTKPKLPENFEATTVRGTPRPEPPAPDLTRADPLPHLPPARLLQWTKLESAIYAVNTKVSSSISKEELYRSVEDLCMHKVCIVCVMRDCVCREA